MKTPLLLEPAPCPKSTSHRQRSAIIFDWIGPFARDAILGLDDVASAIFAPIGGSAVTLAALTQNCKLAPLPVLVRNGRAQPLYSSEEVQWK
jgi:CBS-domain-containing membrane protein